MIKFFRRIARAILGVETERQPMRMKPWDQPGIVVDEYPIEPTHPAPEPDPNVIRPLHKLNGRHP